MQCDAVQAKVQQLRARQTQWLREREAEQDRESVEAEIHAEAGHGATVVTEATLTPGKDMRPGHAANVIDRLTQRITDRLRDELRAQLQTETARARVSQQNEGQKLEGYLAKEIESQAICPICLDEMVPPKRAPVLLFPCGHSFCSVCISSHMQQHGKSHCPCCRMKIECKASNISLQQLIQGFVTRRDKVRKGAQRQHVQSHLEYTKPRPASPTFDLRGESDECVDPEAEGDDDESRLQRERETLTMRCRVLKNELLDVQAEEAAADAQLYTTMAGLQELHEQEATVNSKLQRVQAELAAVQAEMQAQQGQLEEVNQQRQSAAARAALIQQILAPLQKEVDKVDVLLSAMSGGNMASQSKNKLA
ncbi:hypothetical protein WJX72_003861 [[Myrmecia] bisecta]|uniref:RING-type domain-containing protein n=1 Tax=[Myrmecia] bisecta TaxID=41462 RepID=A0AAW1R5S7_9CHLO